MLSQPGNITHKRGVGHTAGDKHVVSLCNVGFGGQREAICAVGDVSVELVASTAVFAIEDEGSTILETSFPTHNKPGEKSKNRRTVGAFG